METSEQILVVILATALAVLLVLAIVIAVLIIKLLKTVGRITDKAEHVIQTAEHVGEAFSNVGGPLAIFKVIKNITELVSKHNKKG